MGITQQVLSEARGARNIPLLIQVRLFHWRGSSSQLCGRQQKAQDHSLVSMGCPECNCCTQFPLCSTAQRNSTCSLWWQLEDNQTCTGPQQPQLPKALGRHRILVTSSLFWDRDPKCRSCSGHQQARELQTETFQSPPVPAPAAPCAIITHRSPPGPRGDVPGSSCPCEWPPCWTDLLTDTALCGHRPCFGDAKKIFAFYTFFIYSVETVDYYYIVI